MDQFKILYSPQQDTDEDVKMRQNARDALPAVVVKRLEDAMADDFLWINFECITEYNDSYNIEIGDTLYVFFKKVV